MLYISSVNMYLSHVCFLTKVYEPSISLITFGLFLFFSAFHTLKTRMNKWCFIFLATCFVICDGREPFKPIDGTIPFMVYYASRYRGICVGPLVSRMVVITAAACVVNPMTDVPDTRPINVVTGTKYRHPRRGIRVQVTKLLLPKFPKDAPNKAYLVDKSVALMLLKRKVPDVLAEVPLRALDIDWRGEEVLTLQEQCLMPGWHFHYKGDKIFPVQKFLLQRNIRVQFLDIVKMHLWCDALTLKLQKSLDNIGYEGYFDRESHLCVRDGMYGAPLVCKGRVVAMMLAPDAQWTNCTGFSNILHQLNSKWLHDFFNCVHGLFEAEFNMDWELMKKSLLEKVDETYDYIPALYDKVLGGSSSWSDEL